MKKILTVFLSILLILSMNVGSYAGNPPAEELTLQVQECSGPVGTTVTVPVTVDAPMGLHGFQFSVNYDKTALSYVSSEITIANKDVSTINVGDGTVEFIWTDLKGLSSGSNITIVNLTFKVLSSGTTLIAPSVSKAEDCFYYVENSAIVDYALNPVSGYFQGLSDTLLSLKADSIEISSSASAFSLPISIENAVNVYGYAMEIHYDENSLRFDEGILEEIAPYGFAVSHTPGTVRLSACTEANAPINGNAVLAHLNFTVLNSAVTEWIFTVSFYNNQPAYTLDSSDNTVNLKCNALLGRVTVAELLQDTNGDGEVNIADVTALLNHLSDNTFLLSSSGDLNSDGQVNIQDVTVLLNFLSK